MIGGENKRECTSTYTLESFHLANGSGDTADCRLSTSSSTSIICSSSSSHEGGGEAAEGGGFDEESSCNRPSEETCEADEECTAFLANCPDWGTLLATTGNGWTMVCDPTWKGKACVMMTQDQADYRAYLKELEGGGGDTGPLCSRLAVERHFGVTEWDLCPLTYSEQTDCTDAENLQALSLEDAASLDFDRSICDGNCYSCANIGEKCEACDACRFQFICVSRCFVRDVDRDGYYETSHPTDGSGFENKLQLWSHQDNCNNFDDCKSLCKLSSGTGRDRGIYTTFDEACGVPAEQFDDYEGPYWGRDGTCCQQECSRLANIQTDVDTDCVGDSCDNCPNKLNLDQVDRDEDGVGDDCDNCPFATNPRQEDADGDNEGDACKGNADGDDYPDNLYGVRCAGGQTENCDDNCPQVPNVQYDTEGDGVGDECDNCWIAPNPDQADVNNDNQGDACWHDVNGDGVTDFDVDGDGLAESVYSLSCRDGKTTDCNDNCPFIANADQADLDGDGVGELCDSCDDRSDPDGDDVGDVCDNCPNEWNPDQADWHDWDGIGDACDPDLDNDGVDEKGYDHTCVSGETTNCNDNCPFWNPDQIDNDGDGIGDDSKECQVYVTADDDWDGVRNIDDLCPGINDAGVPAEWKEDRDNDGVADCMDSCPDVHNAEQADHDGDWNGMNYENDYCPVLIDGVWVNFGQCFLSREEFKDIKSKDPVLVNPDHPEWGYTHNFSRYSGGDVCDADKDGDLVPYVKDAAYPDGDPNAVDNCPYKWNADQAMVCAGDRDSDLIPDESDNCPDVPNGNQKNSDGDSYGDLCDNCRFVDNPDQADADSDGIGDTCPPDADGDGVVNSLDNCRTVANSDQSNNDGDPLGDACDNCPNADNTDQADLDTDKVGDACDGDIDGDDISNDVDNCPLLSNDQADIDGDEVGDACDPCPQDTSNDADGDGFCGSEDNCPDVANANQSDVDGDGIGDVCDPDSDNDGIENDIDNCPLMANPDQADDDQDGIGDACEADSDGDGVIDDLDNCVYRYNPTQADWEGDGLGDLCDPDDDNDGILEDGDENRIIGDSFCAGGNTVNCDDNCRTVANSDQANQDGDRWGDACDLCPDAVDSLPPGKIKGEPPPSSPDNDGDTLGNGCDPDDDNDGILDDGDGSGVIGDNRCTGGGTTSCDDNCQYASNPDQADTTGPYGNLTPNDGIGDACSLGVRVEEKS